MGDVFAEVLRVGRPALRSAAVAAGEALGLYAALATPLRADEAAAALGVAGARRLRRLLDVLALEGVVEPDGALRRPRFRCRTAPDVDAPVPDAGWGRLAEVIRNDRPLPLGPSATAAYQTHLAAVGAGPAAVLARTVLADGERHTLLDAGGGLGTYLAAFLDADPARTGTLLDVPDVAALAGPALAGYGDRARVVAGDLLQGAPGEGFDAALLSNVLHLLDEATCQKAVRRCAAALRPGGKLVVKDVLVEADRRGPALGVYFALNMAVWTAGGDVWPAARVASWMLRAGLTQIGSRPLEGYPDSVVVTGLVP